MREVWLVLAADDRQVMQVCHSEQFAAEQAHEMDAIYERWPVDVSDRHARWRDALNNARVKALVADMKGKLA